jgi:CHAD domain-containing protein
MKDHTRSWGLSREGFAALRPGLTRIYAQGRKAMKKAYRECTDDQFHEWRKRVKDHWYHNRLLGRTWPEVMSARIEELKRLSDLLGDDHDLAVLCDILETEGQAMDADAETLICLCRRRQEELRADARDLGERLYAKSPECLAGELEGYWKAWRGGA